MRKLSFLFILICLTYTMCSKELRYSKHRNSLTSYPRLNDTTLLITAQSTDPEFGITIRKPIQLGVVDLEKGADNIKLYLNALEGPHGESIKYTRLKACCAFRTKNSIHSAPVFNAQIDEKYGMLEVYQVEIITGDKKISYTLYFNLYDQDETLRSPSMLEFRRR